MMFLVVLEPIAGKLTARARKGKRMQLMVPLGFVLSRLLVDALRAKGLLDVEDLRRVSNEMFEDVKFMETLRMVYGVKDDEMVAEFKALVQMTLGSFEPDRGSLN
jgi:hypothetical protein